MGFRGFPPELFDFFEGLHADNSKSYWQANKAVYDEHVRAPLETFCGELDEEFGPFNVFRPYRDVRFSKDKTPYKEWAAAAGHHEDGNAYYFHLGIDGMYAGTGMYVMAADQLDRFRKAIEAESTGTELAAIVKQLRADGFEASAHDSLKTAPRGYPKDHPRIELLRGKGLVSGRSWPVSRWMHTAKARDRIADVWRRAAPLNAWLLTHVGPSDLPPDERGRR
jgi:uncharacterized protein (TIGR02453 family)